MSTGSVVIEQHDSDDDEDGLKASSPQPNDPIHLTTEAD